MEKTAIKYRNRFKTSKRKLPRGIAPFFKTGDEIIVEAAYSWMGGVPIKFESIPCIISCMDEYAIVCDYKNAPNTILIIDWKKLHNGELIIDNEIMSRIQKQSK
jgi:hypothetical protein